MTYGHLQADCLYTGISSGPNARCRVWEAFIFTSIVTIALKRTVFELGASNRPTDRQQLRFGGRGIIIVFSVLLAIVDPRVGCITTIIHFPECFLQCQSGQGFNVVYQWQSWTSSSSLSWHCSFHDVFVYTGWFPYDMSKIGQLSSFHACQNVSVYSSFLHWFSSPSINQ